MMRVAVLLLLVGCGTKPALPPIEVRMPVVVPCLGSVPTRPAYATETLPKSATDIQFGDALAGDWIASRGYEAKLETAIAGCTVLGMTGRPASVRP